MSRPDKKSAVLSKRQRETLDLLGRALAAFSHSVSRLSHHLGVSRTTFYKWRNLKSTPSEEHLRLLKKLANGRNEDPHRLFTLEECTEALTRKKVKAVVEVTERSISIKAVSETSVEIAVLIISRKNRELGAVYSLFLGFPKFQFDGFADGLLLEFFLDYVTSMDYMLTRRRKSLVNAIDDAIEVKKTKTHAHTNQQRCPLPTGGANAFSAL